MERFISEYIDKKALQIITPDDNYHYFFAYYDMRATGKTGYHLAHRVKFMDRIPTKDDIAELGYLKDGKFVKFAESTAWNFQQGAMLQYHPFLENTVFYNVCENGKFMTVTHNFVTGEKRYAEMATACISPDGKWGLGINFGRVYAFRAGYGYAGFVDKNAQINAPENDGVFLVDMQTGKARLLISCADMLPLTGFDKDDKIVVNHVTFNPTSKQFNILVRRFITPTRKGATSVLIGNLAGKCYSILQAGYFSHYWWAGENELLAHTSMDGGKTTDLYLINTIDGKFKSIALPEYHGDIHCSMHRKDGYIIGDGYDDEQGYRSLMLRNAKTGAETTVFKAYSPSAANVDVRCDLHARFVWEDNYISFDTTQNGKRQIAVFPVSLIKEKLL
ncbi:MAG: hypothetical protein J6A63_06055 [Clostridia bacterium]|nr:hypothetical protein [Clostridia bacterium]